MVFTQLLMIFVIGDAMYFEAGFRYFTGIVSKPVEQLFFNLLISFSTTPYVVGLRVNVSDFHLYLMEHYSH